MKNRINKQLRSVGEIILSLVRLGSDVTVARVTSGTPTLSNKQFWERNYPKTQSISKPLKRLLTGQSSS